MKYLGSVRCTKSDHNIYFFRFGFRLGENNMRSSYTGTLLSSNVYSYNSGHHRVLLSHKYLLAECRANNAT